MRPVDLNRGLWLLAVLLSSVERRLGRLMRLGRLESGPAAGLDQNCETQTETERESDWRAFLTMGNITPNPLPLSLQHY